ncbi:hypothetical protein PHAVU_010G049500 [Phaseolus vulgaris]|uniref:Uncharacterized protein n=1 Tax=Phaseolus vulgaris TaxID=3885 RepID=V7ALI6_PHAVU|nr:hypothetical protein PHAVU_010G049500g [Phaseolus vulgaris]ESW06457.1 hypothetical protein PHAVU_010G049500g [Phaseolus vulgaris]
MRHCLDWRHHRWVCLGQATTMPSGSRQSKSAHALMHLLSVVHCHNAWLHVSCPFRRRFIFTGLPHHPSAGSGLVFFYRSPVNFRIFLSLLRCFSLTFIYGLFCCHYA